MSILSLLKNELKVLLRQKSLITSVFLIVICMSLGINSINNSNSMSLHNINRNSTTIAFGTAQYGAMLGTLLFAILTVLLLSKDKRTKCKDIVFATSNSSTITIVRVLSMLVIALFTILTGLITIIIIQKLFFSIAIEMSTYLYTYFLLLALPIFYSILIASGIYLISNNIDITILSFGALYFFGTFASNYLMLWVKPFILLFSDFAGVEAAGKLIIYNRILWLALSLLIFSIGLMCRRKYSMSLKQSLNLNIKSRAIPLLLALSLIFSLITFINEPYLAKADRIIDDSSYICNGVILKKLQPQIELFPNKGSLAAKVTYELENIDDERNINFMTNEGLKIEELLVNGQPASYKYLAGTSIINIEIPNVKNLEITISYKGSLKYDSPYGYAGYISRQSVYLLECSYWVFRPLVSTAAIVDSSGSIKAPSYMTIITPGSLISATESAEVTTWSYSLKSASIDLGVFGGNYIKRVIKGSIPIEFYYSGRHEQYIDSVNIENYIKKIVDYYTDNFGAYYSTQFPLKIVATAIYKTGGHSSINVVTVAEYMLNRELNDSSQYKYDSTFHHDIEIIAHEISHQWWGSGVDTTLEEPWSCEGLANYSAYKYLNHEFGEQVAYATKSLWEYYVSDVSNRYFIRHPEAMKNLSHNLKLALDMEHLKMQLYSKMPLMLLKGEEALSEDVFLKKLSAIYSRYLNKEISYSTFLAEMNLTKEAISYE